MVDTPSAPAQPQNENNWEGELSRADDVSISVSDCDDPDPLHENATKEEKLQYVTLLSTYYQEMLKAFENSISRKSVMDRIHNNLPAAFD